jgi:hypothetical protein
MRFQTAFKKEVYMWWLTSIFTVCAESGEMGSLTDESTSKTAGGVSVNHFEQQGLNTDIFEAALYAYEKAVLADVTESPLYTVVDLRMHSKQKRLWTVNVQTGELLFHEVTTHGRGSDSDHNGYLDSVSNTPNSKKSSVGLYKTAEVYNGKHGQSLLLDGLEEGFNDNARDRSIVIHGADYAGDAFVQKYGKAGRSLGCPAVSNDVSDDLITTIKEGSLLFIYANDEKWLNESTYLP